MARRDKAEKKAKRIKLNSVKYQIDNGDIVFLEGPYGGKHASQLFMAGAKERDYVITNLWFTNDEKVMEIIRKWTCK
jgi:ABC-type uncharacterized transport system YnjBCD ATPase subunit